MKNIIKNVLLILASFSSAAYAGSQADTGGGGFLVAIFLGFCALIVLFQLVPAAILFVSLVRGMFTKRSKETPSTVKSINS